MLYDCWRQVAESRRTEVALLDLSNGRRWTFEQLAAAAEQGTISGPISFPSGGTAEFVLEVLRAWRQRRIACPLEQGQKRPELHGKLPTGTAHLKSTSATTGTPRLVALTAAQLKADADNIVATMGLRPDWPNLGVISLAHSYGFSNLVLPMLLHGIQLILAPSALPEALRQSATAAANLTIAGVPALWRTWHDSDAIPRNVRLAISAGAPLAHSLEVQVFSRFGLKIHNFYGSSECGGIAYDSSEKPRAADGEAGPPMRNVQVSIAENGCVEVRSSAVAETYWPEPSDALRKGVFRTSDLGEIRKGIVYLQGRATDQINVAGRKVVPEVIERVLAGHPQVKACLAFGIPSADARRGETIVACVAGLETVTGDALKQYALTHLPAWQVPREWWFVDTLEANHRGKLSRSEWRKRYLQKQGTQRK